jgi:hypothetical protein
MVVDRVSDGAEIAGEHARSRARSADDISLALAHPLVVGMKTGAPTDAPNWFHFSRSRRLPKKLRASIFSFRRNSYSVPRMLFVPDFVVALKKLPDRLCSAE